MCLTGPTAAGKSAAALAIAARWPIEIVNVDSATIYRGMDIGTAKPDAAERAAVPQHLLDIKDPSESFSAGQFRAAALALIAGIRARGRTPLLAGGTMMYFKALRDGLDTLPPADPRLRAELDAQAARLGWPALHARLAEVDPPTAARLSPNDSQRIQRALEIHALTGRPMSALLTRDAARPDDTPDPGDPHDARGPGGRSPRYVDISLEPSDRAALHARIGRRFDAMLDAGLLEEVRRLYERGDLHPGLPSIRCVGYRQAWAHLAGETSHAAMREQAIAATRQLAKRQLTWLRALPARRVVDCLAGDAAARVVDLAAAVLEPAGRS
ncbi:tRNA (adenosine(37)-N6)-dimethylallyltransferase MiaA [Pigmentiphaga soli]|uniref:tRNA dimethylallyltransferase n=1 Tax=Pigmentiphaga soli TaxID=1007095 RepID=A0ABP8HJG1_9BURK